jgi:predicted XRE-type DNA-binding protein
MNDSLKTKKGFVGYAKWRESQNFDEKKITGGVKKLYRKLLQYKLRELRISKNITQQELAEALGITQNRVSKFERLDLDKAEIRTIRRYLEALGGTLVLQVELEGKSFQLALD